MFQKYQSTVAVFSDSDFAALKPGQWVQTVGVRVVSILAKRHPGLLWFAGSRVCLAASAIPATMQPFASMPATTGRDNA